MSQLRFGASDVAGVRFAVSPVWETVSSMWALADPVRHAVHLPWLDQARVTIRRPDVAVRVRPLVELTRPRGWLPDFLTPPAARPDADLAEQLDQIAATPPDVVVRDLLATIPARLAQVSAGPLGLATFKPFVPLPSIEITQYWHERYHRDSGHRWLRSVCFDLFGRSRR